MKTVTLPNTISRVRCALCTCQKSISHIAQRIKSCKNDTLLQFVLSGIKTGILFLITATQTVDLIRHLHHQRIGEFLPSDEPVVATVSLMQQLGRLYEYKIALTEFATRLREQVLVHVTRQQAQELVRAACLNLNASADLAYGELSDYTMCNCTALGWHAEIG
jgi:hypothetical protein